MARTKRISGKAECLNEQQISGFSASRPLESVRRPHWIRFILVKQFLLSRVPEIFFLALGPAVLFPELIGARRDFLFARLCHVLLQ